MHPNLSIVLLFRERHRIFCGGRQFCSYIRARFVNYRYRLSAQEYEAGRIFPTYNVRTPFNYAVYFSRFRNLLSVLCGILYRDHRKGCTPLCRA
jgi:hypothetical protein